MEKILFISFALKKGNTDYLFNEVFNNSDYKIQKINLKDFKIRDCKACFECKNNNFKNNQFCKIKDDMQKLYKLLLKSDIIIIFTPIYFSAIPGFSKKFIDRTNAFYYNEKLKNKKLIVIVIGGSSLKYSKSHFKDFFRLFSNAQKIVFKKIFFLSSQDIKKMINLKDKSKILKISNYIKNI
ncbi:MAG: flavodoxin family protein [Candidatus Woesearchaeota archaeon]